MERLDHSRQVRRLLELSEQEKVRAWNQVQGWWGAAEEGKAGAEEAPPPEQQGRQKVTDK